MAANPFATPGEWLRCALHAHTTNSDGELAPTLLARHYARAGFDVLAITDHHVRTVEPSTENLLIIPSTELDARVGGTDRDTHVLAFGVSAEPAPRGGELLELDEIVRWVRNDGGVPFLAHSYWSGLRTVDFEACEGLVGIEIYNAGCELETGRGLATLHWDEALEAGHHLLGIATDDCHHPGFDSSLAWVWVRSGVRSAESVLVALREGAFYSSTGPRIHALTVEADAVVFRSSPVRSARLLTVRKQGTAVGAGRLGYVHSARVLELDDRGEITAARLARPGSTSYGRLELRDAEGGVAWTNPLWS